MRIGGFSRLNNMTDTENNDLRPSWYEAFVLTAIFALLCFLLASCKTVYRDVEVIKRDTLVVKDSVKVADTITQVRVEREIIEKEVYKDRTQDYTFGKMNAEIGLRVDTVRIYEKVYMKNNSDKAVLDSLVKALERYEKKDSVKSNNDSRIETKTIEKPLTMQQKFLMFLGQLFFFALIALGVGYATYLVIRKNQK